MSGSTAYASVWLPIMPMAIQFFEVDYEWEDYPEPSGWDDPGTGGVIYLTRCTWLNDQFSDIGDRVSYGIEVPRHALDATCGLKTTLHDALCASVIEDAQQSYIEDASYEDFD
jgi:hypothetical protein